MTTPQTNVLVLVPFPIETLLFIITISLLFNASLSAVVKGVKETRKRE